MRLRLVIASAAVSLCSGSLAVAAEPQEPDPAADLSGSGQPLTSAGHEDTRADSANARDDQEPSPTRRALGIGAAVVPGVLTHGAGHWVIGRHDAAGKLLVAEGIGFGTFLLGGVPIVLSGASRYVVGPAAALTMLGFGVFAVSFLADVYGTAVPLDARGSPLATAPSVETELGYRYVYDPQFAYRHFVVERVALRFGRLLVEPSAWFAADDLNSRWRLLGGWRLLGPLPAQAAPDGSRLDVHAAATHQRYDSDRFSTSMGEASVDGRLDLARVDADLRGAFVDLGVGLGVQRVGYELSGVPADTETLLLGGFGFGAYLGQGRGEVRAYYDHRHDDYAAGLKITGLGSGVAGHFGLEGRYFFTDELGLSVDAEVGSAYLAGLGVVYRQGGAP